MSIRLCVVQGRPRGKQLTFARGEYVFGRGAECHVRPNSGWVSRQHCLLRVTDEGAWIRDLGSRNGTLVNGTRIVAERCLAEGDTVEVGQMVFEVRYESPASFGPPHVSSLRAEDAPAANQGDLTGAARTTELLPDTAPLPVLEAEMEYTD